MLGVVFALISYVAFSQFVRRGVTPTPELAGLDKAGAVALLVETGLRVTWAEDESRYDENVPARCVLLQRPPAGTLVKRGSEVVVILSKGPQMLAVPDVRGTALQAARVTLAAAGLTVGQTLTVYTGEDAGGGGIFATRPASAERVERAAPVDLFLALERSGPAYVMPDLVNKSYDEVRAFFERHGFRLGRVSYQVYPGVAPGIVLRQFPPAGHPLHQGDVIALGVVAPLPGTVEGDDEEADE